MGQQLSGTATSPLPPVAPVASDKMHYVDAPPGLVPALGTTVTTLCGKEAVFDPYGGDPRNISRYGICGECQLLLYSTPGVQGTERFIVGKIPKPSC